jgi:hypothetical protein
MENLPCVDDFPIETSTGWWSTYPSEKYEFVNGKDDPIYEMENIKCSKPPTSGGFDRKIIYTWKIFHYTFEYRRVL